MALATPRTKKNQKTKGQLAVTPVFFRKKGPLHQKKMKKIKNHRRGEGERNPRGKGGLPQKNGAFGEHSNKEPGAKSTRKKAGGIVIQNWAKTWGERVDKNVDRGLSKRPKSGLAGR